MKIDYPELEGKIIDVVQTNGKVYKSVVVGCSYHVGITIICNEGLHKGHKFVCLNRKKHKNGLKHERVSYRTKFHQIVKSIQEGKYVFTYSSRSNNLTCAFMS